ncbi:MAG: hypothetical protein RLO50_17635 [Azospirillaceae bacterium]
MLEPIRRSRRHARRACRAGALAALAALCLAATAQARSPAFYQDAAEDFLAGIGIDPDQVSFGTIDVRERETNFLSETALVWIRLPQCPGDWLVLRIHEAGTVEHSYMRDGCPVPGVNR